MTVQAEITVAPPATCQTFTGWGRCFNKRGWAAPSVLSPIRSPGARRVEARGPWGERVAFRNPDGDLVLVVQNSAGTPLSPIINLGGRWIRPTLSPHAWNTFMLAR